MIDKVQELDLRTTMGQGYLCKSDRAAMANSVELRAPFISEKIVEFVIQNRSCIASCRNYSPKHHLRLLAATKLPEYILAPNKLGFSFPLRKFIYGPDNVDYFSLLIKKSDFMKNKYSNHLFLKARVCDHSLRRIYLLIMLELWQRRLSL
jgi:asparagine synthase (glutamine-hydrolysing)